MTMPKPRKAQIPKTFKALVGEDASNMPKPEMRVLNTEPKKNTNITGTAHWLPEKPLISLTDAALHAPDFAALEQYLSTCTIEKPTVQKMIRHAIIITMQFSQFGNFDQRTTLHLSRLNNLPTSHAYEQLMHLKVPGLLSHLRLLARLQGSLKSRPEELRDAFKKAITSIYAIISVVAQTDAENAEHQINEERVAMQLIALAGCAIEHELRPDSVIITKYINHQVNLEMVRSEESTDENA